MRLIILLLILPFFAQGQTTPLENFYKEIRRQFFLIDSLRFKDDDYETIGNDSVVSILRKYKENILNFPDTLDYDHVYIAKSADKNLALVSWDTRMGGTMIDFATVAIFKSGNEVKFAYLKDSVEEGTGNTMAHYNSIHTITTDKGKKIYLAWGNGQGSTQLPWQELRAISIVKGTLGAPDVFPGEGSSIFISFDLSHFKDDERVPTIKVLNGGKTIRVPIPAENGGTTGKYKSFAFNGQVYKPAR